MVVSGNCSVTLSCDRKCGVPSCSALSRPVQSVALYLHCQGLQLLRSRHFYTAHQAFVTAVQILKEYQDDRSFFLCLHAVTKVAECKWHLKHFTSCIELCDFVLRKTPQDCHSVRYQALLLRGLAYQPSGQILLALTDLEHALALAPPRSQDRVLACIAVVQREFKDSVEPACSRSNSHASSAADEVTQSSVSQTRTGLHSLPAVGVVNLLTGHKRKQSSNGAGEGSTWTNRLTQEYVAESQYNGDKKAGTDDRHAVKKQREA